MIAIKAVVKNSLIKPLEATDLPEGKEIVIYIPKEKEEYSEWTDEEWQRLSLRSFMNTEDDKEVDWVDFFNVFFKSESNIKKIPALQKKCWAALSKNIVIYHRGERRDHGVLRLFQPLHGFSGASAFSVCSAVEFKDIGGKRLYFIYNKNKIDREGKEGEMKR